MRPDADELTVIVPKNFRDMPGIEAGFSLRHGGASSHPYRSLNLGLSTGDDPENVNENRRRFVERFGLTVDGMAIAGQVHGSRVIEVAETGLYRGIDGLVTVTEEIALCVTSADCPVILFADSDTRVVAACHSGWRGTVARISQQTITAMTRLGAQAAEIRAWVSPSISVENFEVGSGVAAQFDERYVVRRSEWERPHVDLKAVIHDQLAASGLLGSAIEISEHCTYARTDDFYSHRGENGTTGRMMGLICLTHV